MADTRRHGSWFVANVAVVHHTVEAAVQGSLVAVVAFFSALTNPVTTV